MPLDLAHGHEIRRQLHLALEKPTPGKSAANREMFKHLELKSEPTCYAD